MMTVKDIECANCNRSDLESEEVTIYSESALDIECDECGAKTQIRESTSEVEPRKI